MGRSGRAALTFFATRKQKSGESMVTRTCGRLARISVRASFMRFNRSGRRGKTSAKPMTAAKLFSYAFAVAIALLVTVFVGFVDLREFLARIAKLGTAAATNNSSNDIEDAMISLLEL